MRVYFISLRTRLECPSVSSVLNLNRQFTTLLVVLLRNHGLPGVDTSLSPSLHIVGMWFFLFPDTRHSCVLFWILWCLWEALTGWLTEVYKFMSYWVTFLHMNAVWSNSGNCHISYLKPWSFLFWKHWKSFLLAILNYTRIVDCSHLMMP